MKIVFKPDKYEGVKDINTVEVHPDQFVLLFHDRTVKVHFSSIARWPKPALLFRWLSKIGIWPNFLPVANRDGCIESNGQYFEFYTHPPIRVYMPDSTEMNYSETLFFKVRNVIESGKYSSFDIG